MLVPSGDVAEGEELTSEKEEEGVEQIGTTKHCLLIVTTSSLWARPARARAQRLAPREDSGAGSQGDATLLASAGPSRTSAALCARGASMVEVYDLLPDRGSASTSLNIAVFSKARLSLLRRNRGTALAAGSDGCSGFLIASSLGDLLAYSWSGRLRWRSRLPYSLPSITSLSVSSPLGIIALLHSDSSTSALSISDAQLRQSSSQHADSSASHCIRSDDVVPLAPAGQATSVCVSEGWRAIAVGTASSELYIHCARDATRCPLVSSHQLGDGKSSSHISLVTWSPGGDAIAALVDSSSGTQTMMILTPAEGHELGSLQMHQPSHSLAWASDSMSLVASSSEGTRLTELHFAKSPMQSCASWNEPALVPLLASQGVLVNEQQSIWSDDTVVSFDGARSASSSDADEDIEFTLISAPDDADSFSYGKLNRSGSHLVAVDAKGVVAYVLDLHSKEWQPVCSGTHPKEEHRSPARASSNTGRACIAAVAWLHDDTLASTFSDGSVHVHRLGTNMPIAKASLSLAYPPTCADGLAGRLLVSNESSCFEMLELSMYSDSVRSFGFSGSDGANATTPTKGVVSGGGLLGQLLGRGRHDAQSKEQRDPAKMSNGKSGAQEAEPRPMDGQSERFTTGGVSVTQPKVEHKLNLQLQPMDATPPRHVLLVANGALAVLERPGGFVTKLHLASGAEEPLYEREELVVAPADETASEPRLASLEARMGESEAPIGFGPMSVTATVQLPRSRNRFRPASRAVPCGHFAIVRALQAGESPDSVAQRVVQFCCGSDRLVVGNTEAAFAEAHTSAEVSATRLAQLVRAMPRGLGLRAAVYAARKAGYEKGAPMLRDIFGSASVVAKECLQANDPRAACCALVLVQSIEGLLTAMELGVQVVEQALESPSLSASADVCWEARQFVRWCSGGDTAGKEAEASTWWRRWRGKQNEAEELDQKVSDAILTKATNALSMLKLEDVEALWRAADERNSSHELNLLLTEQRFNFKRALKVLYNAPESTRTAASFLLDKAMQKDDNEDWRVLLATALSRMDIVCDELQKSEQLREGIRQSYQKAIRNALGSEAAANLIKQLPQDGQ